MPETPKIHTEHFTIRASEVNLNGKTTLPAICELFQEVAGNNAKDLSFDITDLKDQNMTWVLHRMDIKIDQYPDWRQNITIETWPAAGDALRAYRNYRILDEAGNQLCCCLSYWMMINLDTRRPIRIPQEVLDARLPDKEHVLEVKRSRISPIENSDHQEQIHVRSSDLDMNNHVNNARYIEWMMECLSLEEQEKITDLDIIYAHESNKGDVITASVLKSDTEYEFLLTNQDGKTIALGKTGVQ